MQAQGLRTGSDSAEWLLFSQETYARFSFSEDPPYPVYLK